MTTALLTALALSIGLGYFGWLIQKQIWSGAKSPSSPVEYGRKFGGYLFIAASISGGNLFIRNEFSEALIKFAIILVLFLTFGFAVGWLYGFIKKSKVSASIDIESDAESKKSSLQKFPFQRKAILTNICVALVVAIAAYAFFNASSGNGKSEGSDKSKWIPFSNIHVPSYRHLEVNGKFNYYDELSIIKSGSNTYGFIGSDTAEQGSDGRNFVKQKVEADCSVPKFRRIESYVYTGNLEKGLGNLIEEDKNFQKTIATTMLAEAKDYVHNGGWTSREDAMKQIQTYSTTPYDDTNKYGHMVGWAKRDLAILNWLCN